MESECRQVADRLHQAFEFNSVSAVKRSAFLTNEILLKIKKPNTFKTKSEATF